MPPKKKSEYAVPKLKDFSAKALEKAAKELVAALDAEAKTVRNEAQWKAFRDRWMARTNGILTQINDLWLKAAPKEAKREAGQKVNELKVRVGEVVESKQVKETKTKAQESHRASDSVSVPA